MDIFNKHWIYYSVLSIFSILLIDPCDAYRNGYSSNWYVSWYIWVVLFAIACCCCGAAGSYYRRRMLMRANNGRRENRAYLNPAYPQPYPSAAPGMPGAPNPHAQVGVVTPPQPGMYAPQAPPAYNSVNTISAYQPGGDQVDKKEFVPPPSYAEVCETSNGPAKAGVSQDTAPAPGAETNQTTVTAPAQSASS